jgi:hypothetical protein
MTEPHLAVRDSLNDMFHPCEVTIPGSWNIDAREYQLSMGIHHPIRRDYVGEIQCCPCGQDDCTDSLFHHDNNADPLLRLLEENSPRPIPERLSEDFLNDIGPF